MEMPETQTQAGRLAIIEWLDRTTGQTTGRKRPEEAGKSAAVAHADRTGDIRRQLEPFRSKSDIHADNAISGVDIMAMDIPDLQWVVEDLLPEGLTILAGRPKTGKSWMALSLALDVASGDDALGERRTCTGDVLYIALEDSVRRLKYRLSRLRPGGDVPGNIHFELAYPRLDKGGFEKLDRWLDARPEARLVIVDTVARIMPPKNSFAHGYDAMGRLQRIALDHRVSMLLLMHQRKAPAADIFDTINGTLGLPAAADAIMVLDKARGADTGRMSVTGRDLEEKVYRMAHSDMRWTIVGTDDPCGGTATDRAAVWLGALLAGGEVALRDIEERAGREGIGRDSLKRAKGILGVMSRKVGREGWSWRLPGEEAKAEAAVGHAVQIVDATTEM